MDTRVLTRPEKLEGALSPKTLTHLQRLEAESIHIMREVVAECERPVMLYSIGKDSAVMLRLAQKAFYPSKLPFPLLHVDTTWKFRDMYEMRERMQREAGFALLVHRNPELDAALPGRDIGMGVGGDIGVDPDAPGAQTQCEQHAHRDEENVKAFQRHLIERSGRTRPDK